LKTQKNSNQFFRILEAHKPFIGKISVNIALVFMSNLCFLAVPFLIGKLTTSLSQGTTVTEIIQWTTALFGCFMFAIFLDRAKWIWEVNKLDCQLPDHLAKNTLTHMMRLSIGQHRNQHSIVTLSKVSGGENAMKNFFNSLFYDLLPTLIGVIISIAAMCIFYPLAGWITALFGILIIWHGVWMGMSFSKPMNTFMEFKNKVMSKSGGELVRHMGSFQIAGEERHYSQRHLRHRVYRRRMFQKVIGRIGLVFIPSQAMSAIGRVLAIGISAYMIYLGKYEVGSLVAVIAWTNNSLGMLQSTQRICRMFSEQWTEIGQYFKIIDTPTAVKEADHPIQIGKIDGDIVFENVFFTYPGSEEHSLQDVSLKIEAGQKVGIVGPSGAGKSTLLTLLQLAYLPDLGSIRIDGIDLNNVEHASYRDCIGFIEQQPVILSASLRENLMFGLSEGSRKTITEKELVSALKTMKLDDLIPRLNRNVGEIGVKLSGGQKQRVAIARVLLKNPDMLVVDEATSAVDPSTERLVHEALDAVSPGATRIFVAHRISTVQDSDLIVVMDKGNIVATGKHEELLEICPLYQDLVSNLLLRT
jgi:ABC-type multidrug transport system fused ATPase/permease subunit